MGLVEAQNSKLFDFARYRIDTDDLGCGFDYRTAPHAPAHRRTATFAATVERFGRVFHARLTDDNQTPEDDTRLCRLEHNLLLGAKWFGILCGLEVCPNEDFPIGTPTQATNFEAVVMMPVFTSLARERQQCRNRWFQDFLP